MIEDFEQEDYLTPLNELKIINRKFDIDWEKVETLEDIKSLLKGLRMEIYLYSDTIPEYLKECIEKGALIECK